MSYQRGAGSSTIRGHRYYRGPIIRKGALELLLQAMVREEWGRGILFKEVVAVELETSADLTKLLQD